MIKKSFKTSKTAILLSVCAATALCANFVGACSADDDDIYYGDELKTRATATRGVSGDAQVSDRYNAPADTLTYVDFIFVDKTQPTQSCTFAYTVYTDGFHTFGVNVNDGENENYLMGSIIGEVRKTTYNEDSDSYTFKLLFTAPLESNPYHKGHFEYETTINKGDFRK